MAELRLGRLIELTADGGGLPTEFRIFASGVNATAKGPIVFDDEAAASVMAAFERAGVDLMIDLAHDSVDDRVRAQRNDADDARGWCRLEVREGPELWAVGVTWTPDGARRLTERTQRYISPVVFYDEETDRAQEIFNLALCSMPATYNAAPLVAARRRLGQPATPVATDQRKCMSPTKMLARAVVAVAKTGEESALVALELSPDQAKKAIAAVKEQNGDAALAFVEAMLAEALGASAEPADDGAGEPPPEPLEDAPAPAEDDEEKQMATALRSVLKLSDPVGIVAEVKRLTSEVAALKIEREADERNERVKLVGELVALGAELPCTAYADPESGKLSDELASKPIAVLRARVKAFREAGPRTPVAAPEQHDDDLTDSQRARVDAHADNPAAQERLRRSFAALNARKAVK